MPQNATSTKPPAVKAAVLVRYAEGQSKAEIARRLHIDRETVTRILSEPEVKEAIEASRSRCIDLLPKAERAIERQLDEGDGDLGIRFLEKSGVLTGERSPRRGTDVSLSVAIANLLPSAPPPTGNTSVIDPIAETRTCDAKAVDSTIGDINLVVTAERPVPPVITIQRDS